jgi:Bacteriophage Lambda NinG protein
MKIKKCRCGADYPQYTSMQNCCVDCLAERVAKNRIKSEKTITRAKKRELIAAKQAIKPLKYWADKAQTAFNTYIRARDGKVCISCGTTNPNIQYCAGHYRTRKAANQLRYNEDNVHVQCNNYCNSKNSGNIVNYRPALIAKIGQERHDALINNHETKRWTKEECQEIEALYKQKLKEMK